jgi:hypothetical protein
MTILCHYEAGGRRQEAGGGLRGRQLRLPLLTFPLERGGLYPVGFGRFQVKEKVKREEVKI